MFWSQPVNKQSDSSKLLKIIWTPIYEFKCYRSDLLEREVHEYLHEWRVANNSEMFSIDSYTAQQVIENLGYKYSTARWDHNGLGIS